MKRNGALSHSALACGSDKRRHRTRTTKLRKPFSKNTAQEASRREGEAVLRLNLRTALGAGPRLIRAGTLRSRVLQRDAAAQLRSAVTFLGDVRLARSSLR